MLYTLLFLVRYLPFWAIPASLVAFELCLYYYSQRRRWKTILCFGISLTNLGFTIFWFFFEGYWKAGPAIRKFFNDNAL